MAGIEQAANDLFFKLRNRFPRVTMGDEDSNATTNPPDARFFNFDYEENEIKFGNVTASLVDNENLKVYFSQDISKYMDREEKQGWYKFLKELRRFAKSHLLGLDVRDITKDILTHEDLKFVSNQNKEKSRKSQIGESKVLWARRGKVSEGNLNNVKIHVVHSERMIENNNNRLLKVDRIFLVNESGEKFLLPFKSVMAAKAMANHVGRGGTPYDNSGRLISDAVMEMSNLRRFATATRRKTFESEDAVHVIEAAAAIKESLKRGLFRLANNSRFDENLEDLGKILAEQDDVDDIKPMFVQQVYNENLDNWINSAAKAYKQYKGNIMEALRESAGAVASKLKDPNFKLVLKDDPSEDRLIASSKYSDGRALLRRILGTISDRIGMEDSEIANWASQIGQDIEEGKASREDMQVALQLAKRYQDDLKKIHDDKSYSKEVRVAAFGKKKDLYGKVKDESMEFENYVNGIGEEEMLVNDKTDECGMEVDDMSDGSMSPMSNMHQPNGEDGKVNVSTNSSSDGHKSINVSADGKAATELAQILKMAGLGPVVGGNDAGHGEIEISQHSMEDESIEEGPTSSPMDRVQQRVASRDTGNTAIERVSERVSSRSPLEKVSERVAARTSKEPVAEEGDEDNGLPNKSDWEYDKEGDMAKDQIHSIVRHAEELEHTLGDDENLPEWVQEKMAQIKGMMTSVSDYMLTQHERGEEKRSGKEGIHGDDDMEEGNEFSGALAKAKASHKDEFEVDGKKYPVKEGIDVNPINDSLALMKKLAGLR
jgi:hypothetical protein